MTKKAIVWIREDLRIENNPAISGMIRSVSHLVKVEEVK